MHQTVESLSTWLHRIERWTLLTGAGVSASSGIPTYRDRTGRWLRVDPIQHNEFVETEIKRKRYWARSMIGWVGVDGARPNATHFAIAKLERAGKVDLLITQNVDRLHQKAGSQRVVDLHGRLDQVICLDCGEKESRQSFQARLLQANPFVTDYQHIARPDGDADVPDIYVEKTTIPQCKQCSGVVMPDVVFFGGTVPRSRVDACAESLSRASGLLVVGSSLQVYSGFRFCRMAENLRIPIIIVNEGETRADDMATLKVEQSAMNRLVAAVDQIIPSQESKSA